MLKWLLQPYPFNYTFRNSITVSLGVTFFVFTFLALFKPFEFGRHYIEGVYIKMLGFGTIAGAITFLYIGIFPSIFSNSRNNKLFPNLFNKDYWKVYKEIVLLFTLLLSVAVANHFYHGVIQSSLPETPIHAHSLVVTIWQTFLIGSFPCIAVVMFNYLRWLKKHTVGAQEINATIEHESENDENNTLHIFSDSEQDTLSVGINELIFIRSCGNYIECYIQENGKVKKLIKRNTLQRVQEQLKEAPQFFRVHRTVIVNLNKIVETKGNAQGYTLKCNGIDEPIPVSRNNVKEFKRVMNG